MLENIVVTASGYEQKQIDAPATIDIVTKEDIEGKAYKSVVDVLDDISGVSIEGGASGKGDGSSIYIRGLSEDYTLFLVDGKAQGSSQVYYNGYGNGVESGWLPPASAIERIEIIKGPMSSLYGSEAMGGVINIITKKVPSKTAGQLTYDTILHENKKSGSVNQVKYYLASPVISDVLGISLYGSYYNRAEDEIKNGYSKREKFDNTIKINYKFATSQDIELMAAYAKTKNNGTKEKSGFGELENKRLSYALTHNISWIDNINTTSFITHEDVDIENGSSNSAYKRTSFNSKSVARFNSNTLSFGLDYRLEETVHDKKRFHGQSPSMDLKRWQGALFLEDEFALRDDFFITGGIRWDKNEHYGNEFVPRLYGVYLINDNFVLKGGISKGYKAPSLKQADPSIGEQSGGGKAQSLGIGSIDIGNFKLSPETSQNYEISLAYDDEKFGIDSTVFYTDFKDKISKAVICSSGKNIKTPNDLKCEYNGNFYNNINEYQNVSKAQIKGFEANLKYNFTYVKTKLNYTYSKSEQKSGKNKGQPFFNTPTHALNFGVDFVPNKSLKLWSKAKYKGKTQDFLQRGGSSANYPAYTIVDVGVKYKFSKNLDLFAGIYNLFDKEITSENYGKLLDGRRYNLGISARF